MRVLLLIDTNPISLIVCFIGNDLPISINVIDSIAELIQSSD